MILTRRHIPHMRLFGKRVMASLFATILLVISPTAILAAWEARVVDVYDGDTLILSDDGRAKIIRLFGVDCPEKGQPFGLKAKDYSRNMVVGKEIRIVPVDTKRYQRCIVYVKNKCLNKELMRAGYAWHEKRISSDENWEEIEKEAAALEKGLWSQENPIPPWKFRGEEDEHHANLKRSYTIKLGGKHKVRHSIPRSISRKRR